MAAECELRLVGVVTGLEAETQFHFLGDISSTPTKKVDVIQVQSTADTAEALELGGITTPQMVVVYASENGVSIDTSFDTTFHAELSLNEGEFAVFAPTGTVYIKNATATETVTVEVVATGT